MEKSKPDSMIINHHRRICCDGCSKQLRHVSWFMGHYLCRRCIKRKNMPLVGYKNKIAFDTEEKLLKKDRAMPYISWDESKILWREYMSKGLSFSEAKSRIRSIKIRVRRSHWAYRKQNQEIKPLLIPQ